MDDLTRRAMVAALPATAGALSVSASASAQAAAPASGQAPGFYRYRLGDCQITSVTDGVNTYPIPDNFVLNASKTEVSAALKAAFRDGERISVPYTPIVVNTGSRLVVIDTGTGEANFTASEGAAGQFHANLRAAGISAADVDTVIISHFHGDHVNGLLTADGKPAFPKAEILVPRLEWAFWMDDGEMSRAPKGRMEGLFRNSRRVFDALGRKVTPYEWDHELVPGITSVGTPGHTPGHTSFRIASGDRAVFVQSDVTNVPVLFARNPGWHLNFDQDPQTAEATRRKVYDMLAAERMMVQGFHYPFPSIAHVEKVGAGYREIPVPWSPVL